MKKTKKSYNKKTSHVKLHKKRKYNKAPKISKSKKVKVNSTLISSVISEGSSKKKRKTRTKNLTRMYFTQDTEDAIVRYNAEENMEIREQIFREKIHLPFQKLVENIFNTFKFSYFETDPQNVQKECLTHLVSNMHKYKENRGKAFSYFSIIAKHFLILLNNTNYKKFNQNIEIGEDREENTVQLQHVDKYYKSEELTDFIRLVVEFWEANVNRIFTKQRDIDIANAVVELFRNSDRIDAYNKKALYLYIREIALCKTQQITKVITRMKQYYDNIQQSYLDHGHINTRRYSTA